jgi:hypothetical protein
MTTDNFCFYLQNRQIQTRQTGGQWYSDTFPFSIPWFDPDMPLKPNPNLRVRLGVLVRIHKLMDKISLSVCPWQAFPA